MPNLTPTQILIAACVLALTAVLGLGVGYLISAGRLKAKDRELKLRERRETEVRDELSRNQTAHNAERAKLDESLQSYRGEVRDHFEHTSQLMSQMVDNYRKMYLHLAAGAEQLADMHEIKEVVAPPPEAITEYTAPDTGQEDAENNAADNHETAHDPIKV